MNKDNKAQSNLFFRAVGLPKGMPKTYHKASECSCRLYNVSVIWVGFLWRAQPQTGLYKESVNQLQDGGWTFPSTSTCLSSSCSSVGYLSSLMKGLLRLVVRVRMPGTLAPWLSMNLLSSSLCKTQARRQADVTGEWKRKRKEQMKEWTNERKRERRKGRKKKRKKAFT